MPTETAFKYLNEVRFMTLSNWSVGAILSDKVLYKDGFKLEPIGNLIIRNREKEILEDDKAYKQVTIKLYGKGVIQRGDELIFGKDIGTKNQFRISEGQFIMSKIDARNGAFGIVPAELEGAITTQDFLSYNINTEKILPEFFNLITGTKHFAELCQKASSGTTGRQRVDEKAFLGFRIPVPDKKIQSSLVKNYYAKIDQAISLKEENRNLQFKEKQFINDHLGITFQSKTKKLNKLSLVNFKELSRWDTLFLFGGEKLTSKYDLVENRNFINEFLKKEGKSLRINTSNIPKEEFHYIGMEHIEKDSGRLLDLPLIMGKDVKSQTIKVPKDYFIYGKLRPYLNKYWYNNTDTKNIVCSSEFFVFNCLETIDLDYYKIILSSEIVQKQIHKEMSGARMPRISEETFKSLLIPFPDRKTQKEIVTKCYHFRDNIDSNLLRAEDLNVDAQNEFRSAIFNID